MKTRVTIREQFFNTWSCRSSVWASDSPPWCSLWWNTDGVHNESSSTVGRCHVWRKCGDAPKSSQESPLSHVRWRPCLVLTHSLRRTNPAVSPLHAPAVLDPPLLLPSINNLRREKDDIKIQRQHAAGPIMWMSKQLFETAECECQFRWVKQRLVLVVLYTWKITFSFSLCVLNLTTASAAPRTSWRDWGWSWKALAGAWYATSC